MHFYIYQLIKQLIIIIKKKLYLKLLIVTHRNRKGKKSCGFNSLNEKS